MKWKVLAASVLLGLAATAPAKAADMVNEVQTFTLANGMKFIVL